MDRRVKLAAILVCVALGAFSVTTALVRLESDSRPRSSGGTAVSVSVDRMRPADPQSQSRLSTEREPDEWLSSSNAAHPELPPPLDEVRDARLYSDILDPPRARDDKEADRKRDRHKRMDRDASTGKVFGAYAPTYPDSR